MIFEDMTKAETKAAFLDKRRSAVNCDIDEVRRMADYILTDRFDADIRRLIDGDYYFDPPTQIRLRKGQSNRKRVVYKFSEENKNILQYLAYMLLERYDDRFPDELYSFRKDRPIGDLFSAIRRCDPNREKYVVKADIHSFGESIDTDLLGERLKTWFSDEPEVRLFIMWLVKRNVFVRDGRMETGFTSVMPGNPIVAFLQNVFLLDVDRCIAANARVSCRYTDDICAICDARESAEETMRQLREIVSTQKLTMNGEKTGIIPPGESYDLFGLKFAPGFIDISDNTYLKVSYRIKHRADNICRKIERGDMSREIGLQRMAAFIERYYYGPGKEGYVSWTDRFFPLITTVDRLKRLDWLSQECLRYVATGRHTNAKYRFRYADIRALGYVPTVRAYYEWHEKRIPKDCKEIRNVIQ